MLGFQYYHTWLSSITHFSYIIFMAICIFIVKVNIAFSRFICNYIFILLKGTVWWMLMIIRWCDYCETENDIAVIACDLIVWIISVFLSNFWSSLSNVQCPRNYSCHISQLLHISVVYHWSLSSDGPSYYSYKLFTSLPWLWLS